MGALMSRLWADIVQYLGWVAVPTGYGTERISYMDSGMEEDTSEIMESSLKSGDSPGGSTVRHRVKNTPEKSDRSPIKVDSSSPVKSSWNDVSEHPKPKLEVAPPNKKTKTESDEKKDSQQDMDDMQFESVPNMHFGEEDCPESLSPDYLTPLEKFDPPQQNGHAEEDERSKILTNSNQNSNNDAQNPLDGDIQNGIDINECIDTTLSGTTSPEIGKNLDDKNPTLPGKSENSNENNCDATVSKDDMEHSSEVPKIIVSEDHHTSGSIEHKKDDSDILTSNTDQIMNDDTETDIAISPLEVSKDVVMAAEKSQDIVIDDPTTSGNTEQNGEENQETNGAVENENKKATLDGDDVHVAYIRNGEENDILSLTDIQTDTKITSQKTSEEENINMEINPSEGGILQKNDEKTTNMEAYPSEGNNVQKNDEETSNMEIYPEDISSVHKNDEQASQKTAEIQTYPSGGSVVHKNGGDNTENVDPNIQKVVKSATKTKQICVQWTGEADDVFITGTWLNWSDKVELQKSDENIWLASLDVEENIKEIEMKFIVDGNWLISPDIPTVDDGHGNKNNYIKLIH